MESYCAILSFVMVFLAYAWYLNEFPCYVP